MRTTVQAARRPAHRARVGRWLAATIAVTVLAYRPALDMGFVGDDFMILHLLRQAGGLQHIAPYFQLNFFGYYRPVAFLSHALDWHLWNGQAFGFHLTSLLLHAANAALVFLFARRLVGVLPAIVAALLFALHPSNHEAVFWISSRFDLLATLLMLIGLIAVQQAGPRPSNPEPTMVRNSWALHVLAVTCFALALLSKESAFAFPLLAAAYDVFIARRAGASVLRRLVPLVAVVAAYLAVRVIAGGPELGEGLARLAKIGLLGGGLAGLAWLAFADVDDALGRLLDRRRGLGVLIAVALAISAIAAVLPATAPLVRPKLAFASFAGFYLLSPVITGGAQAPPTFDPNATIFWAGGLGALIGAAILLLFVWQRDTGWVGTSRSHNATVAFLLVFIVAAILPISSMTEGKRYLYLASIGVSLLAGYLVGRLRGTTRTAVLVLVGVILAVSGWQIQLKADDWKWAGTMTADAVRLVRQAEPNACGARNVLFLTAPVNIRDVYCNFYDYTFEDLKTGCHPASARALVRVVGEDVAVDARPGGPDTIVIRTRGTTRRLVTAADLRHFDIPLWPPASRRILTAIGDLSVTPVDKGQQFELHFAGGFDPRQWRVLYYDSGRVRELALPPAK